MRKADRGYAEGKYGRGPSGRRQNDTANGPGKRHMDYDHIRHAVKTGDKILELARTLNLDPERHTIKDLADTILRTAVRKDLPSEDDIPA